MENINNKIDRRKFLKIAGSSATLATTAVIVGCNDDKSFISNITSKDDIPTDKMTYRTNPTTGDKVSLLGYGCMRLPTVKNKNGKDVIDQETVNQLTDFAIEHGVNYFDTSPAYCQGLSEHAMGIALSKHQRNKYFIATKLSNFAPDMWSSDKEKRNKKDPDKWSTEASIEMYHNSFKELKVDYIDYMLLHGVGMGGMEVFDGRFIQNGMLDFLLQERKAGRIRNLGFSYHGDVQVFDYLLSQHDKYKWNFVQIQLNYVDWKHAKEENERNTNVEYLYNELTKRGIPVVVMEPLLGGRLANLNYRSMVLLKKFEPEADAASWAFRFVGSQPNVITALSGMTYMENLRDNLRTYSPLKPLNDAEKDALEQAAKMILEFPLIQCNACNYCMPCPYGLNIPAIFTFYNKCLNVR